MAHGEVSNISDIKIEVPVITPDDRRQCDDPSNEGCKEVLKKLNGIYFDYWTRLNKVLGNSGFTTSSWNTCASTTRFVDNITLQNTETGFAWLTACRNELAEEEELRQMAKKKCLFVRLTDRADRKGADGKIKLPVGKDYKNCFEMEVPLHEEPRLITIHLPPLLTVGSEAWLNRGSDNTKIRYVIANMNPWQLESMRFLIKIEPVLSAGNFAYHEGKIVEIPLRAEPIQY